MTYFIAMRTAILIVLIILGIALNAQTVLPTPVVANNYRGSFANNFYLNDSFYKKKWVLSKYSGISTSFSFFKGGNASVVSAPLGLQLNRKLNNNLFAFAGALVAPSYINFNRSFMSTDFSKANQNNTPFKTASLGIYTRAELGLQYVNDERTFSISGSFGVERSNYPAFRYNGINNIRQYPNMTGR